MYAKKPVCFIAEAEVIKDVKPAPEKKGLGYYY